LPHCFLRFPDFLGLRISVLYQHVEA
jgi:hypothetical protein